VLWRPPARPAPASPLGRFLGAVEADAGRTFAGYEDLHAWSIDDPDAFWDAVWTHLGVVGDRGAGPVLAGDAMPDVRWFPGARISFAENALRRRGSGIAVVARSDTVADRQLTWDEMAEQVSRCRAGLRRLGVQSGDRVVGYLPNAPEALVAFLAAASLGAVWACCPPEFGAQSTISRFAPLEPTVLLAVSGYRYGAKQIDRSAELAALRAGIPSLRHVVEVPGWGAPIPDASTWDDLLAEAERLEFERVAFDHPLYVLFSSGTTGPPKAIVHGHGGITVEHLKVLALHHDLDDDDRFLWFTTTGWMMWNLQVSGLLTGSTVVLFDGDPGHPDLGRLWRVAVDLGVTVLGVSAPFLMACRRAGVDVSSVAGLEQLRGLGSTGAPLPAEGFRWVHDQLPDVWLASISGGTDVCSAFVGGSPWVPVLEGRISCRYLGAAVEAFDDDGRSVVGSQGELVLTQPLPSMPVSLWDDDADRSGLRAAYFSRWPGVWNHGDWVTFDEDGSCVISGRSDATLNRAGVRLGTSELYAVVEDLPGVRDSLVVHLADGGERDRLVLFVVLEEGVRLDDELVAVIGSTLRRQLSPRHVPDEVHAVTAIPRTHSGKKMEVPVKRLFEGRPIERSAMADPSAADDFERLASST
jgi:acetoacetyl-CoA synthetase